MTKVNPEGNALVWSTYLGGSGCGHCRGWFGRLLPHWLHLLIELPHSPGSFPYVGARGYCDIFIVKLDDR